MNPSPVERPFVFQQCCVAPLAVAFTRWLYPKCRGTPRHGWVVRDAKVAKPNQTKTHPISDDVHGSMSWMCFFSNLLLLHSDVTVCVRFWALRWTRHLPAWRICRAARESSVWYSSIHIFRGGAKVIVCMLRACSSSVSIGNPFLSIHT